MEVHVLTNFEVKKEYFIIGIYLLQRKLGDFFPFYQIIYGSSLNGDYEHPFKDYKHEKDK